MEQDFLASQQPTQNIDLKPSDIRKLLTLPDELKAQIVQELQKGTFRLMKDHIIEELLFGRNAIIPQLSTITNPFFHIEENTYESKRNMDITFFNNGLTILYDYIILKERGSFSTKGSVICKIQKPTDSYLTRLHISKKNSNHKGLKIRHKEFFKHLANNESALKGTYTQDKFDFHNEFQIECILKRVSLLKELVAFLNNKYMSFEQTLLLHAIGKSHIDNKKYCLDCGSKKIFDTLPDEIQVALKLFVSMKPWYYYSAIYKAVGRIIL